MRQYIFTAFLFLIGNSLLGQKNEIKPQVIAIPFTLTSHNNITIEAVIGTSDTLSLMFHTAAGSITLTKKATEKMKNMKWSSESEAQSWGGKATTRYSEDNTIKIGPLRWEGATLWEDENSGPTTDGKFGPDLFEDYAIEIDFDESLIILHNSLPKDLDSFQKVPLFHENGMLFIAGSSTINGVLYENKFLIHSGYGSGLLFDDEFVAQSKIGEGIEITDQKELKDSFGNIIKVNKGTIPSFKIGSLELKGVPVGFFEGKIGRQKMSVLGGDIIKRFQIVFDKNRENIYLKKNELAEMAYTQF